MLNANQQECDIFQTCLIRNCFSNTFKDPNWEITAMEFYIFSEHRGQETLALSFQQSSAKRKAKIGSTVHTVCMVKPDQPSRRSPGRNFLKEPQKREECNVMNVTFTFSTHIAKFHCVHPYMILPYRGKS